MASTDSLPGSVSLSDLEYFLFESPEYAAENEFAAWTALLTGESEGGNREGELSASARPPGAAAAESALELVNLLTAEDAPAGDSDCDPPCDTPPRDGFSAEGGAFAGPGEDCHSPAPSAADPCLTARVAARLVADPRERLAAAWQLLAGQRPLAGAAALAHWREHPLRFAADDEFAPGAGFDLGLRQTAGGPCGVLACLNCWVLAHALFIRRACIRRHDLRLCANHTRACKRACRATAGSPACLGERPVFCRCMRRASLVWAICTVLHRARFTGEGEVPESFTLVLPGGGGAGAEENLEPTRRGVEIDRPAKGVQRDAGREGGSVSAAAAGGAAGGCHIYHPSPPHRRHGEWLGEPGSAEGVTNSPAPSAETAAAECRREEPAWPYGGEAERSAGGALAEGFEQPPLVLETPSIEEAARFLHAFYERLVGARGALLCVVASVLLTRGADRVLADADAGGPGALVLRFGHSSQELVNLFLTGAAASNIFDGEKVLCDGRDGDVGAAAAGEAAAPSEVFTLKGIRSRQVIGFLTSLEALAYCATGEYYKSPRLPLWVAADANHYSVLFSDDVRVSHRTPEERERIRLGAAFDALDPEQTGTLPAASLQLLFFRTGIPPSFLTTALATLAPISGGGVVLRGEFIDWAYDRLIAAKPSPTAEERSRLPPRTFNLFAYDGQELCPMRGLRCLEVTTGATALSTATQRPFAQLVATRWPGSRVIEMQPCLRPASGNG